MNLGPMTWVFLFFLIYSAIVLFWARQASAQNTRQFDFFTSGKSLSPWMSAVGVTGASISGWIVLGFPQSIASQGLGFGVLALAGIIVPLTGVLFFKAQWQIATRYNFSTQGQLFNGYFGGRGIGVVSALIAVLFAIGFSGLQLRAIGTVLTELSENQNDLPVFIWAVAALLASYVVIGGLRTIGYLSVIQTVLIATAIAGMSLFVLIDSGGFSSLNMQLAALAKEPDSIANGYFQIAGVIQFTAGIGIEAPIGGQWTAVMITSSALALLGIQASPMITQLLISTRSSSGIAAGQTWVFSAVFGALIIFGIVAVGSFGMGKEQAVIPSLLLDLSAQSPWFKATIAIGLIAAVQVVCGLSLLTAAHALIADIYVPFYHKGLPQSDQILYGRVCILILLIIAALLATLSPVALSKLGALALPAALQLWPALIGLCWFQFISRQAVVSGLMFGLFAVLVTDHAGIAILGFLGLDLPWGRFPWTIHSAGWGLFVNLLTVLIISAITQGRGHSEQAPDIRNFLRKHAPAAPRSRGLKPAAWSAVLAWFFLAVGPGAILGNQAFGVAADGPDGWITGMPSIWAWIMMLWVLGVFLIWFLSYKMNLATSSPIAVTALEQPIHPPIRDTKIQEPELIRFLWTVVIATAVITVVSWVFGS
jgi:solute:Na+ symporter, SSS family